MVNHRVSSCSSLTYVSSLAATQLQVFLELRKGCGEGSVIVTSAECDYQYGLLLIAMQLKVSF